MKKFILFIGEILIYILVSVGYILGLYGFSSINLGSLIFLVFLMFLFFVFMVGVTFDVINIINNCKRKFKLNDKIMLKDYTLMYVFTFITNIIIMNLRFNDLFVFISLIFILTQFIIGILILKTLIMNKKQLYKIIKLHYEK